MTTPLDAYIGFAQHSFKSNEQTWVALLLNKTGNNEGKYDFKGNDFILPVNVFTGLIEGENHWLICVLSSGACLPKTGVFEFKVWKQGENGAKGSFDKSKAEELAIQWQKDGCLAAISVNEIPVLKTLVKVLHDLKVILRPLSNEITVRLNIEKEQCPEIENALSVFIAHMLTGEEPAEGTEAYKAATVVSDAGLMALPCLSEKDLPFTILRSILGKETGRKVECFPFTGTLPSYESLTVALPTKEEKKASKSSWSGSGNVDPKKVLEARKQFIIDEMKVIAPNANTLTDVYTAISGKENHESKEYLEFLLGILGK